jgi:beta-glucosidase
MPNDYRAIAFRLFAVPFILFLCLCVSFAQNPPATSGAPYRDPSKPLSVRVDDLVSRMTLEEKASQVVNQAARHSPLAGSRVRQVE